LLRPHSSLFSHNTAMNTGSSTFSNAPHVPSSCLENALKDGKHTQGFDNFEYHPVDAGFDGILANCCCLGIYDRDAYLPYGMLGTKLPPPSIFEKLVVCDWNKPVRTPNDIENIPEIAELAGATLQKGTHSTAGSVQTLRFAHWDKEKRAATVEVFGGACGGSNTGTWTEPVETKWICLAVCARLCDYTYVFNFAEDWRSTIIDIKVNCCCCIPCIPAWFSIPKSIATFEARQHESSKNGEWWIRSSAKMGGPMEKVYDLVSVYGIDGKPGRFHKDLEDYTPKKVMITR